MEINQHYCANFLSVKVSKLCVVVLLFVSSFNVMASFDNDELTPSKNIIEYYKNDNITNQVPYFDNRFRLDAYLDEITLVFYRKSGSTPIILIRPDGSKIRINNFNSEKVQWFDDSTFDMIKIKEPMPGPWQAVGNILPNSHILVVSDIKIAVEPLPEIAFSGETLKVVGKLFNGDDAIDSPYFKKVVNLDVNFYSTNNPRYENFGADAIKVTSFRDDGRGLDEYANDRVFTGEFILDFSAGEWQPIYLVKLPMATRELRQDPILLKKAPVELSVITSTESDKPHQIIFTIDPSFVDPDSLIFQGKFTFPDKQEEPFSIMEGTGNDRSSDITYTEPGIYRVNVRVFGNTITGREFRLVIPEFSFNVEDTSLVISTDEFNVVEDIVIAETAQERQIKAKEQQIKAQEEQIKAQEEDIISLQEQQKQVQHEKEQEMLIYIAAGNGVILVIAVILFFTLRRKKPSNKAK